jgi:DNA modification methylase
MSAIETVQGENFVAYHGDCVEVLAGLPTSSVTLTVTSCPFASLYTYSASERDLGNCKTHDEFHEHFSFVLGQLYRVTMPGRVACIHCMDLPTSKERDGYIGLVDFPGQIIRSAQEAGWIWHSKVTIWKDPVTAMQRTKALGLLHKQLLKDSCMSRMGIPDYVIMLRKPGDNPSRVSHTRENFPVSLWQKWASPVWDDIDPSDTLQFRNAREDDRERHVCPLQLEVIRRCVRLYSNPGDVVIDPFGGIGSTGHIALEEKRRSVLVELKESYFRELVKNMRVAEQLAGQPTLFDLMGASP